jgi:hypothetical protein
MGKCLICPICHDSFTYDTNETSTWCLYCPKRDFCHKSVIDRMMWIVMALKTYEIALAVLKQADLKIIFLCKS